MATSFYNVLISSLSNSQSSFLFIY